MTVSFPSRTSESEKRGQERETYFFKDFSSTIDYFIMNHDGSMYVSHLWWCYENHLILRFWELCLVQILGLDLHRIDLILHVVYVRTLLVVAILCFFFAKQGTLGVRILLA